jgi:hypothetical protein
MSNTLTLNDARTAGAASSMPMIESISVGKSTVVGFYGFRTGGVMKALVAVDSDWFSEAEDEADRAAVDAARAEAGSRTSLEDLKAELGL